MVRFLIQRPIAVLMAFTACFIIGLVTYFTIPVSLLPDIAIPEITVQVSGQNTSARELENTLVKPIRQQLMQVAGLKDIESETRDGNGVIRLSFEFGTNTDLAFIEVNEKIDAAMSTLPREMERPRVVKASATDIPVFCLNLTLKGPDDETAFLDLCQFAENVIKRRIEQLPEVAMVDVTGVVGRQLQIVPDMNKLETSGITLQELETALANNNIEPGSMTVRDGYYEYNIKFSTLLRTLDDVRQIYLSKNGRIFQLKDLAEISIVPEKETGVSMADGKRAVTLAVIKQSDESMDKLKTALGEVTDYFTAIYPDINFSITRNQTELLDYTISNLKQNLSLGFLFICIVAVLFLGDIKSPLVIGLSMVVSIVTSFSFFYLFHMSLNIISPLRPDPGVGYDDRQFHHRNGKHRPVPRARRFAGRSLHQRNIGSHHADAEFNAYDHRRVLPAGVHERYCRSHLLRPGIRRDRRSAGVILHRHHAVARLIQTGI